MHTDIFTSHGFELDAHEIEIFERFLALFREYNAHTNLSAIRDEDGIVEKHFVDSLYGAQAIDMVSARLLDIGSGGGFPGIPLKIVIPKLQVILLDSVGKKVKAMNHFVRQLQLQGIQAIHERAELLAKTSEHKGKYDFVVSRATAYMTDILTWAEPFLTEDGKIILYKMPSEDEQKAIKKITKKHGLILESELTYELAGKERVIYAFSRA